MAAAAKIEPGGRRVATLTTGGNDSHEPDSTRRTLNDQDTLRVTDVRPMKKIAAQGTPQGTLGSAANL